MTSVPPHSSLAFPSPSFAASQPSALRARLATWEAEMAMNRTKIPKSSMASSTSRMRSPNRFSSATSTQQNQNSQISNPTPKPSQLQQQQQPQWFPSVESMPPQLTDLAHKSIAANIAQSGPMNDISINSVSMSSKSAVDALQSQITANSAVSGFRQLWSPSPRRVRDEPRANVAPEGISQVQPEMKTQPVGSSIANLIPEKPPPPNWQSTFVPPRAEIRIKDTPKETLMTMDSKPATALPTPKYSRFSSHNNIVNVTNDFSIVSNGFVSSPSPLQSRTYAAAASSASPPQPLSSYPVVVTATAATSSPSSISSSPIMLAKSVPVTSYVPSSSFMTILPTSSTILASISQPILQPLSSSSSLPRYVDQSSYIPKTTTKDSSTLTEEITQIAAATTSNNNDIDNNPKTKKNVEDDDNIPLVQKLLSQEFWSNKDKIKEEENFEFVQLPEVSGGWDFSAVHPNAAWSRGKGSNPNLEISAVNETTPAQQRRSHLISEFHRQREAELQRLFGVSLSRASMAPLSLSKPEDPHASTAEMVAANFMLKGLTSAFRPKGDQSPIHMEELPRYVGDSNDYPSTIESLQFDAEDNRNQRVPLAAATTHQEYGEELLDEILYRLALAKGAKSQIPTQKLPPASEIKVESPIPTITLPERTIETSSSDLPLNRQLLFDVSQRNTSDDNNNNKNVSNNNAIKKADKEEKEGGVWTIEQFNQVLSKLKSVSQQRESPESKLVMKDEDVSLPPSPRHDNKQIHVS